MKARLVLKRFLPLLTLLALGVIVQTLIIPGLESFLAREIVSLARSKADLNLTLQGVQIQIFPPLLTLQKPKLETLKIAERITLESATTESLTFHLDVFLLLIGRLEISEVVSQNAQIRLITPKPQSLISAASRASSASASASASDQNPPPLLPVQEVLKDLDFIPIRSLRLLNLSLSTSDPNLGLWLSVQNLNLLLSKQNEGLQIRLAVKELDVFPKPERPIPVRLDMKAELKPQLFSVKEFELHTPGVRLILSGQQISPSELLRSPNFALNLESQIQLPELSESLRIFYPNDSTTSGSVHIQGGMTYEGLQRISGKVLIETKSVQFDSFTIGDASIRGEFENNRLTLPKIEISHPAGKLTLSDSLIKLGRGFPFQSKVEIHRLQLKSLFEAIDLEHIPVHLDLTGNLNCEGDFQPRLDLICRQGHIEGAALKVKEILKISKFKAAGTFRVTDKSVQYSARVTMPKSQIQTEGEVDFNKGFEIDFQSDSIDFADIEHLAGIHLQGRSGIQGRTSGDSTDAIIEAKIQPSHFQINDFFLGDFTSNFTFYSPVLKFTHIKGNIQDSKYVAQVNLDVRHENLNGEFQSDNLQLNDIKRLLKDFYSFPLEISGSGRAKIDFWGPLSFWKLNFNLDSQFRSPLIAGEYFDKLILKSSAQDGNVRIEEGRLFKEKALIEATGDISSDQILNLAFSGKNLKLEESQIIRQLSSQVSGVFDFTSSLSGPIKDPDYLFNATVKNTILNENPQENSHLYLNFNRNESRIEAALLGNKITGKVSMQEKTMPRLRIQTNVNNWNFTEFLSLLGNENLSSQYSGNLNLSASLESQSGSAHDLNGRISIPDFFIKRGSTLLSNSQSSDIYFKDGRVRLENFELHGPETTLTLQGRNLTLQNLDLDLNAKGEMRVFQLFLPFLDDLGGLFSLQAQITSSWLSPELLGHLNLKESYIKLKDFPHPLEKVNAEVSFSHRNVLINKVQGQFAGGALEGGGSIQIQGLNSLSAQVRAHVENCTLLVPTGVRSTGNADITIQGEWFPYIIAGTYVVKEALITREFESESPQAAGQTGDRIYLPKILRHTEFDPIHLNLEVLLDKNIQIRNSNVEAKVSGKLLIQGPPMQPGLTGKVLIEKNSKLNFRDRTFNVLNGYVDFRQGDESNPEVFLLATSRVDEYDVNLRVDGKASALQFGLTSTPALPEADIVSLLLFGQISSKLDQNLFSQTENIGIYEVGQYLFRYNPSLRRKIKDALGVDLDISSEYDTTTNTNVNKVTGSRKVTEKLSFKASRTLGGPSVSVEAQATYKITPNLSALGKWKSREATETQTLQGSDSGSSDTFGLDLEFKREFR